jgi:Domain of unknown function (DUF4936)
MSTPGAALYVYYKVAEADAMAVATAAKRMQTALQAAIPGLVTGLARRPDMREGLVTLMESYIHPNLPDDPTIAARIEKAAASLAPWRKGRRYSERFDPL